MAKKTDSDLHAALRKRALGYAYEEKTLERNKNAEEGPEMVVTKVVQKEVQPDTAAIKLLMEEEKKPEAMEIGQLLEEKERIIREYLSEQPK